MKHVILSMILSLGLFGAISHNAKVLETLSSGGYTYMKVKEGQESYWIAMTQRDVTIGQNISFNDQGWMNNFHSKTLNRTFKRILFASDDRKRATEILDIKPNVLKSKYAVEGTISIAELSKNRDKYAGKAVTIKGIVTKTSMGIIKRNWVHISDGSSFNNMNDIVFTSVNSIPKEGDIVLATGKVILDKDFGYGYFYPLIIEESSFKK